MPNDTKPEVAKDQQYFVSVTVEWGKQDGDTQSVESTGGQNWGYLTYDQSLAVENAVIIPGMQLMLEWSGELGLEMLEDQGTVDTIKKSIATKKTK
jgi:hypothetical protein